MKQSLFSILIMINILNLSCVEENSTLMFKEVNISNAKNSQVEINIFKAIGKDDVSQKINNEIDSVIIKFLSFDDLATSSKSVEKCIEAFNNEYFSFKKEFPESPIIWEAQIDGEITYQSNDIITIAITNYQNTGGAHGNLIISFLNFDASSGNRISNENLFSDFLAFKQLAKAYFENEITNKKEAYFEPDNFKLPSNIGYTDEGLILLYNTYEIAPYATGITEINIPFDKVDLLLNYL